MKKRKKKLFDSLFDRPPEQPVDVPLPDPTRPIEGKVGADHAETAKRAARFIAPKAGSQRAKIIEALYWRHGAGLTAAECAVAINRSRNQTAARLLELHERRWVTFLLDAAGEIVERPTDGHGNRGRVHVLTEQGSREAPNVKGSTPS